MPKRYRNKETGNTHTVRQTSGNAKKLKNSWSSQQEKYILDFPLQKIFTLWLYKSLPPKNSKIQLVYEKEQFWLDGQKKACLNIVAELRIVLQKKSLKRIQLDDNRNASDIYEQLQIQIDEEDSKLYKSKHVEVALKKMEQYFMDHSLTFKLNQLATKRLLKTESQDKILIFLFVEKSQWDKIENIINKILDKKQQEKEQLTKQRKEKKRFIQKEPSTKDQQKFKDEKRIHDEKKSKQSSSENSQGEDQVIKLSDEQSEEEVDLSDTNTLSRMISTNRQTIPLKKSQVRGERKGNREDIRQRKLVFSKKYSNDIFIVDEFKKWIRKNKVLQIRDFIIQYQNQTEVVVSLVCLEGQDEVTKGRSAGFYFQNVEIVELQEHQQQPTKNYIKKYENLNYISFDIVKGFLQKNEENSKRKYFLRTNKLQKASKFTEAVIALRITGLYPEVYRIKAEIQEYIYNFSKQNRYYEVFLDIQVVENFIREKTMQQFLKTVINNQMKLYNKQINNYEIFFPLGSLMLKVNVNSNEVHNYKILEPRLKEIIQKRVKTHIFDELPEEVWQNSQYIIKKCKEKWVLFQDTDKFGKSVADIYSKFKKKNLEHADIIFDSSFKMQIEDFMQKKTKQLKDVKYIIENKKDKCCLKLVGFPEDLKNIEAVVSKYLNDIQSTIELYSFEISQQEAQILEKNDALRQQIQKKKIHFKIRKNNDIEAIITIGKKTNIKVVKNLTKQLEKITADFNLFFRQKQELQYSQNKKLIPLKALLKINKGNTLIQHKQQNGLNWFYQFDIGISDMFNILIQKNEEKRVKLLMVMPKNNRKKFFDSMIKKLIEISQKNYYFQILMISTIKKQDIQKEINITQKLQAGNKKRKFYFTQDDTGELYYSNIGQEKIKTALEKQQNVVVLTNQDLNLASHISHQCDIQNEKITHYKSGISHKINIYADKITFQIKGKNYQFPDSQYKKIVGNKKKIDVSLGMYEINLTQMLQVNLFSGFKRKVYSIQKEDQDQYKGTVNVQYNIKTYQVLLSTQNANLQILEQTQKQIKEFLQQKLVQKIIPNGANGSPEKLQQIKELAENMKINIEFTDQNKDIIISSYDQNELLYFQKTIKLIFSSSEGRKQVSYPPQWQPQTSDIQLFQVNKNSEQFKNVQKAFKITKIKKLQRIQNKILYKKYFDEKQFLTDLHKGKSVKTMMLYHGTSKTDPAEIYNDRQQSFNINYSSQRNLLGKGIYFAQEAAYSLNYSYNSNIGMLLHSRLLNMNDLECRQMFYCEVVVGQSEKTPINNNNNEIKDTSFIDVKQRLKYESRTAFLQGSNVYVVYKSRRAYPSYLISF